jgi:hypothetical protein
VLQGKWDFGEDVEVRIKRAEERARNKSPKKARADIDV